MLNLISSKRLKLKGSFVILIMNPNEVQSKNKKKISNKKLLGIVGGALLVVLLLGGIAAALVIKGIYNEPENVLPLSVKNYLKSSGDSSAKTSVKLKYDVQKAGFSEVSLNLDTKTLGRKMQADIEVNASILRLRGSLMIDDNGNIYVKLKDLAQLLGSDAASTYGIPEDYKTKIAGLEDKWIEITKEDQKTLSGDDGKASEKLDKCVNSVYGLLEDESFGDKLEDAYKKNRFMTIKSSSDDTVDGQKLLKMDVGIDRSKLNVFAAELGNDDKVKGLISDCELDSDSNSSVGEAEKTNFDNPSLTVWADRGKKELKMVKFSSGLSYSDSMGNNDSSPNGIELESKILGKVDSIETPTDVINIKDLLQQFGVDISTLNGSQTVIEDGVQ